VRAEQWAARRKATCARHRLIGAPLDVLGDQPAAWSDLPEQRRIALRNDALIASADALIAVPRSECRCWHGIRSQLHVCAWPALFGSSIAAVPLIKPNDRATLPQRMAAQLPTLTASCVTRMACRSSKSA
jgi:hypothetical protein